ncbi:hypothetical protein DSM07_02390 [Oenococcus sp. UCMA 16435]|nr:hypothetical protein DSM07_02390 [Oenococcus sp. UCMA 16435]MDI4584280.1 hypothetical protein [Oenococcus sp. UCMA 14587]MDN6967025.1 hypothetical protein [Oenococcus sp. UCMA 17063]
MNNACNINGSNNVTGCKLSIYPMNDEFADVITQAIKELNKKQLPIWSKTDLFSTTYRGEQKNVVEIVKDACKLSYRKNMHTVFELTFSKGCPGDSEADQYLNKSGLSSPNEIKKINFPVHCKYSFYAFGEKDYMKEIEKIIDLAKKSGLNPKSQHYATELNGNIDQLFNYFNQALSYAHEHINHYVIEATISVNSPSLNN